MTKITDYSLVFLFDTPALQSDISKFRFDELKKYIDSIVICDLSPVLNPDINKSVTAERLDSDLFEVIILHTKDEIKSFIATHKCNFFYFPMFDDYYNVRLIYYLFSKHQILYGYVNNLNPDVADKGIPKLNVSLNNISIERLKKAFYNRVIRKRKNNPAKLYFYTNELSREHYYWRCNCKKGITKECGVHSFDYDRFLAVDASIKERYAVYLDVYIPYHPDFIEYGTGIDAKKYYDNMNEIFNAIEKKYNCKVLIAAHPRANYKDKKYSFSQEKIIYGKTAELAKGAIFLIGSFSTTNQMAVMANKALVIVCDEEASKSNYCNNLCERQAEFFGTKVLRNKGDVENADIVINEELYKNIRNNYICVDDATEADLWSKILKQVDLLMIDK